MKVSFVAPFDYVPSLERRVTIVYKPNGGEAARGIYTVKRECGEEAIAAGKAILVAEEPVSDAPPAPHTEPE